jgi:uncharacterized membrane protein
LPEPSQLDSRAETRASPLAGVVERNIHALVERRRAEEDRRTVQQRAADRVTWFAGSMYSVHAHLVIVGVWIAANLGWLGIEPFDPTFVILAMAASVEAIFLSTFVLITQNRMAVQADKRAELDLQISMLAEHEVTRLLRLVEAMARRLGVVECDDPELAELTHDVALEKVMDRLEQEE